jgi:micrococcal nuclease
VTHRLLLALLATALLVTGCLDIVVPTDDLVLDPPDHPALVDPPTTGTWEGTIARIVDGDTVRIVVDRPGDSGIPAGTEVRVRLLRIDTPELARGGNPDECLARAATDWLRALAPPGSRVIAAHDVERQDRFGRELAHLWRPDGLWLNGRMLLDGYASVITFPPNVAYDDEVLVLQGDARQRGAGLWSAC